MKDLLVSHSTCLEIFCRAVKKFEEGQRGTRVIMDGVKSREIYTREFISHALSHYVTIDQCAKLSSVVFQDKQARAAKKTKQTKEMPTRDQQEAEDEDEEINNRTFFHRMRYSIIKRAPFVITATDCVQIKKHLAMVDALGPEIIDYQFPARLLKLLGRWCAYFQDEYEDPQTGDRILGITRAIVYFEPFGKIQIDNLYPRTNEKQKYLGHYDIHEMDNRLVQVSTKMILEDNFEKDLNVLMPIGNHNAVTLGVGQWQNIGRGLASGVVIIDRNIASTHKGTLSAKFFPLSEVKEYEKIPPYIREYFAKRPHSAIYSTMEVQDEHSMWKYLRSLR
jgi:hypothetical protein